ncbi:MAG TPA: DUF1553 domain-containing protein [Planctomycetota bacterium]|nr:DUF1553 domain-containing protein [Planctomycetota bacterium]
MRKAMVLLLAISNCLAAADEKLFTTTVAPILKQHCVECHEPGNKEGELDLTTLKGLLEGGDEGPALTVGKSAESRLIKKISGTRPKMPKERKPLSAEQIQALAVWIDKGAIWPEGVVISPPPRNKSGPDFWSFQPVKRPDVPAAKDDAAAKWIRTPIDAFVLAKLAEHKLAPSPEADRRTLIRRLYFDLIGLPPAPKQIDDFVSNASPDAYEKLVEELLASPRYGERWARHWLDVVHYGETHGYDKDQPRPHAWPYRDYVIRSFNEDKPYTRFIQEQIAGDVLHPGTRDGIEALGFIAAGPWDLIGHVEIPESKIDGKIARHLDRDDMIMNTIQTFNSVTIQCAQCHNHKFDPIPQEEYYNLQAVFAALDRTDVKYDADPATARQRAELQARLATMQARRTSLEEAIVKRAGDALSALDKKIAAAQKPGSVKSSKADAYGYHSNIEAMQTIAKWVQIELKQPAALSTLVVHPCKDDFNNIGEGFGFPVRFKIEVSDDAGFANATIIADQTGADFPNPGIKAQSWPVNGQMVRFIRVTATKLAPRRNDFIFALSEVDAIDITGKNVALGASVSSLDSIEAPPRWKRENLVDGYYPGVGKVDPEELKRMKDERAALLARTTLPEEKNEIDQIARDIDSSQSALKKLPPQMTVYAGAVHTGSGAFRGTGPDGGKPRPIFVLDRGNVQKPGKAAAPGALSLVAGLPSRFEIPEGAPESARRAALAKWLTDVNNPLTWRSIVNRVWQYHFGRGIVDSPNDFGANGQRPTHPELLTWLAAEFRDGGQSFKKLHRLIVTSSTYRQSSGANAEFAKVDADNRFLWRMNRRRLTAEEIRDSVLQVAGKLDLTMYGPGFQDFTIDKPQHSPHYLYDQFDPNDPKGHRRAIYRFIVRSQQQPFMTTLDCADPSMQVDKRNESISALQALAMMNNSLMLAMSKHFAASLEKGEGDLTSQIERGWYSALGRKPTPDEREKLTEYAKKFGLSNACRLLFNLSEFVFVD